MSKTYVVLSNSSRSLRKDPYSFFVFPNRSIVSKWNEIGEHDLVFSTAQELADTYHSSDVFGVYATLSLLDGVEVNPQLSLIEAAKAVFATTTKRAVPYVPNPVRIKEVTAFEGTAEVINELDVAAEADEVAAVTEKKAKREKKAKAPKEPKAPKVKAEKAPKEPKEAKGPRELRHKLYANDLLINKLLETPPIQPGSNRHRNMQTVIDSLTVGEALRNLRSLTPPGVPADIDLAIEKGAITLVEAVTAIAAE
jgi:hypothetical protein